jgi:hypothetical protein
LGGGDIAGEGEVGERGEGDVVGAADAGFEHAAAPDGDVALLAEVVDFEGFGEAADAAEFDVDDAAGVEADGLFGVVGGADALVEADGGLEGGLELDVVDDFVVGERLFEHHQVELVQGRRWSISARV